MLPWIFENVQSVERDSYSQISSTRPSTVSAKFCRNVLDGDTTALFLAKHIKRWTFSGSPVESNWPPAFLSMYFETFRYMSNLLELSLSNIIIPRDFFRRLVGVPTLETLKIDNCSLDNIVLRKHLKQFEFLSLKHLTLAHQTPKSDIVRLLPHINLSSLIRLELDISPLLETLPLSDGSLPLEEFYLDVANDPLRLAEFLEKTPNLNVLRVGRFSPFIGRRLPPFTINPQVIPRLTKIDANWDVLEQIVPGRPISCLGLGPLSHYWDANNVKILTLSTKRIVQLKLTWYLNGAPIWTYLPDLESLEVRVSNFEGLTWGEVCFLSS